MDIVKDLRHGERRKCERRRELPESLKPHLRWMLTNERRQTDRRMADRRQKPD